MQSLRRCFGSRGVGPADPAVVADFMQACARGDSDAVQAYIDNMEMDNALPLGIFQDGLCTACQVGKAGVVEKLLALPGDGQVYAPEAFRFCQSQRRFLSLHRMLLGKYAELSKLKGLAPGSERFANRELIFGHPHAGDFERVMRLLLAETQPERAISAAEVCGFALENACTWGDVRMLRALLSVTGPRQVPAYRCTEMFRDLPQFAQKEYVALELLKNSAGAILDVRAFIKQSLRDAEYLGGAYANLCNSLLSALDLDFRAPPPAGSMVHCYRAALHGALRNALEHTNRQRPLVDEHGFNTPREATLRMISRARASVTAIATCCILRDVGHETTRALVLRGCLGAFEAPPNGAPCCILCTVRRCMGGVRWRGGHVQLPSEWQVIFPRGLAVLHRQQARHRRQRAQAQAEAQVGARGDGNG